MVKPGCLLACGLVLCACSPSGKQATEVTAPSATATVTGPSDKQIVDAYIYLYGRYLVLQQENIDTNQEKLGYNKIKYNPLGAAALVNPNLDVAYLEAWIAVDSKHAVVLNVPKIKGRYYTAQLLDGWAEVVANVNERTFPKTPYGKFALVLKGTNPAVPIDAVKIEVPCAKTKMLSRVELKGTTAVAKKLQEEFTLTVPDGIEVELPQAVPPFTHAKPIDGQIFHNVDRVIESCSDSMPGAETLQALAKRVEAYRYSSETAKARVDAVVVNQAIPVVLAGAKGFGAEKGGWTVTYKAGKFGDDMMARDIVNFGELWANETNEAIDFVGLSDSTKQPLTGDATYELRFPSDALPGTMVSAFWSLTLYGEPDHRIVDNALKRYNFSNMSPLKKNPDGSMSIWLSSSRPKGVFSSNWLPTPAGRGFSLVNRMYVAKPHVLDRTWFPPPIVKMQK
jgi:hypothetical protein